MPAARSGNRKFRPDKIRASMSAAVMFTVSLLHAQTRAGVPVKPGLVSVSKASASATIGKIAEIKSFRIVQEKDGPAVEILSTKPLAPAIQAIKDPDRLVIDLANARLDTVQKRIPVNFDQISAIRADQFQQSPPVARVVVDLLAPRSFSWEAAANRLVVHLGGISGKVSESPFQPATVAAVSPTVQPVLTAVRATGPLALIQTDGILGPSITAGAEMTVARLSGGGELHVCPGTTVSVTPSQNRHNVMLSMNAGAMEAHFALDASSDSVMTPDFRILLVGPGEFHYAFSADSKGNTCLRALPGNTSSAIVSELLGDRTYQVKATDQLVFHLGQLDRVDMNVPLECGCPPAHDQQLQASSNLAVQDENPRMKTPTETALSPAPIARAIQPAAVPLKPATAASVPGPATSSEVQVQISAPFVFHATGPRPVSASDVALPLDSRPQPLSTALTTPLPPSENATTNPVTSAATPAKRSPSRGFFRKIGGFFSALFH